MVGVVVVGRGQHVAEDRGSSRLRVLFGLEHEGSAAFAHHETVASAVEGAAGEFGALFAAQGLGHRERRGHHRADDALGSDREHDVGLSGLQEHHRELDRVASRRACGADGHAGTSQPVFNRDLGGGDVAEYLGHEARADLALAAAGHLVLGGGDVHHSAHRGTHGDACPSGFRRRVDTALSERLPRCRKRVLREQGGVSGEPLGHMEFGVEISYEGGDLHGYVVVVETVEPADSGHAGGEVLPEFRDALSDGGHGAHSGDCYSLHR